VNPTLAEAVAQIKALHTYVNRGRVYGIVSVDVRAPAGLDGATVAGAEAKL
jgi:hypothetical protein